jgi:hypothetical protein
MNKRGESGAPAKPIRKLSAQPSAEDRSAERESVGLCADCAHCRRVQAKRAELFYLCGLSSTDPVYPKYPRLPVLKCAGYRTAE